MKRLLVGLLLLGSAFCASYPTIPNTFTAGQVISSAKINANYNAVLNGYIDGTKRNNPNELYINSSLFSDNQKNITVKNITATGTLSNSTAWNILATTITVNSLTVTEKSRVYGNETISGNLTVSGTSILSGNVSSNGRISDKTGLIMPVGSIMAYGGTVAPSGWLICDGSTKDKTVYADLFAVISGNFGTTSNYFNLPDLRGKFARGLDSSAGNDPNRASRTAQATGGNTGDNVGSIQASQFESHTHQYIWSQSGAGGNTYNPDFLAGIFANQGGGQTKTLSSTGGNETRPINVYVNYIIKY